MTGKPRGRCQPSELFGQTGFPYARFATQAKGLPRTRFGAGFQNGRELLNFSLSPDKRSDNVLGSAGLNTSQLEGFDGLTDALECLLAQVLTVHQACDFFLHGLGDERLP